MKNLLYIGNKLNRKQGNLTSIDVLGPLLEQEDYLLFYASFKINQYSRFLDMLWACFSYRNKVDVVIIDTYSTLNFQYAFFVSQLCRLLKLKYIPILHGGNLPNRLVKNPKLCQLIFNNAYVNIAPSLYLQKAFESSGFKNVHHIPNTIDISQYLFKNRSFIKPKLLWVRSFSKIYNPLLAVKVLKALLAEGFEATLCMVGPDSDGSLQKVKTLAKALKVDIILTGKQSKPEWIEISKDYTIFINTTNFDNMPVSVIEAMALGLPIVSTHVGGMPFLIEDNHDGILVEPNDVGGFVNAIKKITSNSEYATQLVSNARKKVEMYDWEIVKHQWFAVLK